MVTSLPEGDEVLSKLEDLWNQVKTIHNFVKVPSKLPLKSITNVRKNVWVGYSSVPSQYLGLLRDRFSIQLLQ